MFKILSIFFLLFSFSFSYEEEFISFNPSLSKELFETIELFYDSPEEIRKFSFYMDVSENKDYEISFLPDTLDSSKSKYTLFSLRYNNTNLSYSKSKLFVLRIDKNKNITIVHPDINILNKSEILSKQDLILKFILETKLYLIKKQNIKNHQKEEIKNRFLNL